MYIKNFSVKTLKKDAKALAKEAGIPHTAALDAIATVKLSFKTWKEALQHVTDEPVNAPKYESEHVALRSLIHENVSRRTRYFLEQLKLCHHDIDDQDFQALFRSSMDEIICFKNTLDEEEYSSLEDDFNEVVHEIFDSVVNVLVWDTYSFAEALEDSFLRTVLSYDDIFAVSIHIAGGTYDGGVSFITKNAAQHLFIDTQVEELIEAEGDCVYYTDADDNYQFIVERAYDYDYPAKRYRTDCERVDLRLEIANHSSSGVSIEGGSGLAQLSLAILCDVFGTDLSEHPIAYQDFKDVLKKTLGSQEAYQELGVWIISETEIKALIANIPSAALPSKIDGWIAQLKDAGHSNFYTDYQTKKPCVIIDDCIELIDEANIEYLLDNANGAGKTYFETYIPEYLEPFSVISEGQVINVENHQYEISAIADIDSLIEQAFEIEFLVLTDEYYNWNSSLTDCKGDKSLIEYDYKCFVSDMKRLYSATEDKLVSLDATLEAALEAFDNAYSD